jgi:ubiquinone/menaquinone biosynthesis C-methylase UbiE
MKDEAAYGNQYASTSNWQYLRGSQLLEMAAPTPGETVLDLGCGTGKLTFELARRVAPTGKVIAIDPDRERLDIAQATRPPEVDNIRFIETRAEQLETVDTHSIDLLYSNYVIHWIPDKDPMVDEMARCLQPKGRCVMEFVGELMPFLREVSLLTGAPGQTLVDRFFCFTEEEWIKKFVNHGLDIGHTAWPKLDFNFDNLTHFFDWWEGTTNGLFLRSNLSEADLQRLEKRFPGAVYFDGNAFQAILTLPH